MADNQPTAEINLDDADLDFELQDEDFVGNAVKESSHVLPEASAEPIEVDSKLRKTAIYVTGVDEMSSEDMTAYGKAHIPDLPYLIEWIDDSSCMFNYTDLSDIDASLTSKSSVFQRRRSSRCFGWVDRSKRVL
jgi:Nuclear cap-binding protein subunit 3